MAEYEIWKFLHLLLCVYCLGPCWVNGLGRGDGLLSVWGFQA